MVRCVTKEAQLEVRAAPALETKRPRLLSFSPVSTETLQSLQTTVKIRHEAPLAERNLKCTKHKLVEGYFIDPRTETLVVVAKVPQPADIVCIM